MPLRRLTLIFVIAAFAPLFVFGIAAANLPQQNAYFLALAAASVMAIAAAGIVYKTITPQITALTNALNTATHNVKALETQNIKLQQADDHRLSLLQEISEAFHAPAQVINSHSQILELDAHGKLNDAQLRSVKAIRNAINTQHALLSDLAEFAQAPKKGLHLAAERLSLPEILDRVYNRTMKDRYKEKSVHYVSEVSEYLPRIVGDAQRMEQVFERLLDWAFDLSAAGGRVCAEIKDCGSMVEISISEMSEGIVHKPHLHLVPKDLVADSAHTPHAGLGATFIKTIIEGQGGTFTMQQQPGLGNTFVVTLPASQAVRKAA